MGLSTAALLVAVASGVGCGKPTSTPSQPETVTTSTSRPSAPPLEIDFPVENSLGKLPCSPLPEPTLERQLVFRTTETSTWGDPLPVCGYLRVPKEIARPHPSSSFSVHVRKHQSEEFHHDSANFQLGVPPLRDSENVFDKLELAGELFFGALVRSEYTTLGPGTHDISLRFFDLESERIPVKVVPGGWRGHLANLLVTSLCQGTLLQDYKEVRKIQHHLSTADMEGHALEEALAELRVAAIQAHTKYAPLLRPDWIEGLRSESKVDLGVPKFAASRVQAMCPEKGSQADSLVYIYEAMKTTALAPPNR